LAELTQLLSVNRFFYGAANHLFLSQIQSWGAVQPWMKFHIVRQTKGLLGRQYNNKSHWLQLKAINKLGEFSYGGYNDAVFTSQQLSYFV
jgi:hypothetical protein